MTLCHECKAKNYAYEQQHRQISSFAYALIHPSANCEWAAYIMCLLPSLLIYFNFSIFANIFYLIKKREFTWRRAAENVVKPE